MPLCSSVCMGIRGLMILPGALCWLMSQMVVISPQKHCSCIAKLVPERKKGNGSGTHVSITFHDYPVYDPGSVFCAVHS